MIYSKYTIAHPYLGNYTGYKINIVLLYIHWTTEREGWARLFGKWWGIRWKHRDNFMMFSERNKLTKSVIILNYRFRLLKPTLYKYTTRITGEELTA